MHEAALWRSWLSPPCSSDAPPCANATFPGKKLAEPGLQEPGENGAQGEPHGEIADVTVKSFDGGKVVIERLPPAKFDYAAEEFGMRVIRSHPLEAFTIAGGFIGKTQCFLC